MTPETGAIEFIQKPKWEDDGSITFRFRAGADGKYFFMGRVCEAVSASNTPINGSVRKGEIIKIHAHAPQGYLKNAGMVRTCDFVLGAPDRYLAVIDLQDHLPQIKDTHLVCVEIKNQWKCTPNSYASTTTPNPVTPETGAIEFIQKPKWEDDGSITFRFRAGADGKYFFMGRVCEAVAASNTPINGSVRKGEIIKIHAHAPQGYLKNSS